MYTPTSDEKTTIVMAYTDNVMIHGEVVSKQNVRVSTWFRTEGAPEYLHILKPKIVSFISGSVKMQTFSEMYLPLVQVIAFHIVPPAHDSLDYDENEVNRTMHSVTVFFGTFIIHGLLRVSTQIDLGTSISTGRVTWMSVYDVKMNNPSLPKMGEIRVPMIIVRPNQVYFTLQEV